MKFLGIIVPLLFIIVLSWYNYLMVQSYNYTIFDLGLSYRLMYLFAYHKTIIFYGNNVLFSPYPFGKYVFLPLSFSLYFYNNVTTPLLLQIIVIASGGYAVFRIAHIRTENIFISIVIELAYFFYTSTYGFMAHGGNYEVFFEGFILIGYMFYIQKKDILAYLAFSIASVTNIWGPPVVLTFMLIDFLVQYDLMNFRSMKKFIINSTHKAIFSITINKKAAYFIIFFMFEIIIFSQTLYFAGGIHNLISASRLSSGTSVSSSNFSSGYLQNFFSSLGNLKIPFFDSIMSPVLFIPLLTPYFIPVLIYFLISWQSPNPVYYNLFQQYPYLFVSFIFIGTIHFFKQIIIERHSIRLAKKLGVIILISSIIAFSLSSPFSISNFQDGAVEQGIHVSNFDKDLTYGLSKIPVNSTIFVQNDLPQLMNREVVYMPGYYHNETVDYAVIIPFGFSPISDQYGGYSPYWASQFQNNTSYGVYEDIMGAIVYKINYTNPPIYYVPINEQILPGEYGLNGYGTIVNNTLIISNFKNVYGNTLWGGGYVSLSPGQYKFTFQVLTNNTSYKNTYYQDIWASDGALKLISLEINGSDFIEANQWQNFTITVNLHQFYTLVECPAFFSQWNGTIEYRGVTIQQQEPAKKLFQNSG